MLNKTDLEEIRKIIREEVENEAQSTRDSLEAEIKLARIKIQNDIDELKDKIKNLEIKTAKMHKELKNEIKMVVHFLDRENVKALERIKRIEQHLALTSSQ